MRNRFRIVLGAAALTAALALPAPAARGQVLLRGTFPAPRGRIAVGFAAPGFAVGSFVPAPYAGAIVFRPGFGYGFSCDTGFVPVRSLRGRWIVASRPIALSRGDRFGRWEGGRFASRRGPSRFASRRFRGGWR